MKLSPEAKARVDALITQRNYHEALWAEKEHARVRQRVTQSNPRFGELIAHQVERTQRCFRMIIECYLEGYRLDGLLIDEEDRDEIVTLIREMVERRIHDVINRRGNSDFLHPVTGQRFPNIDTEINMSLRRVIGEGVMALDVAISDLRIELSKRTKQPTGGDSYTVHVENLQGGIQQGPGNIQNFNGPQFWNGKHHIQWSQLKPEVGIQRLSRVGEVEVTEENIRDANLVGGNPWVELHDATTFGSLIRRYVLGLFTPE
jgi:hypothetical protein